MERKKVKGRGVSRILVQESVDVRIVMGPSLRGVTVVPEVKRCMELHCAMSAILRSLE